MSILSKLVPPAAAVALATLAAAAVHAAAPRATPVPNGSTISGCVFFDHSQDGTWNPGVDPLEVPIAGWRIELWRSGSLVDVTYSDASGVWSFRRPRDGATYEVREVAPGGFVGDGIPGAIWLATNARTAPFVASTTVVTGPCFGALSFEVKVGLGVSTQQWSSNLGADDLRACDPDWRHALVQFYGVPLCLRFPKSTANPFISIYTPKFFLPFNGEYAQLRAFLTKNPHDHVGYVLSREVAASVLNAACGPLRDVGTLYIDRRGDGVLVAFDSIVQGAAMLLCDPNAGLTGRNDPEFPSPMAPSLFPSRTLRGDMLACLNEFGSINNSGDPNARQVVYGSSTTPKEFASPY